MAVEYGRPREQSPAKRPRPVTPDTIAFIAAMPINQDTALLRECTQRLATSDIRYDMTWTFGPFLREVPRRLGANAALDAAVGTLISACADVAHGQRSYETVARYGRALKALRACLADEVVAQSSNTLCAIYVIWICLVCLIHDFYRSQP